MDWWRPTGRAIRWSPVVFATCLALATLVVVRVRGDRLDELAQIIITTTIVIGAVSGLHDPGRDVVHPLPVSTLRRLGQRLVMLIPVVVLAVSTVRLVAGLMFASVAPAPGGVALAALGAVGVAATVALTRRVGTRANDLVVFGLLAWVVGGISLGQAETPTWVSTTWSRWPVLMVVAATLFAVVAATRGAEA